LSRCNPGLYNDSVPIVNNVTRLLDARHIKYSVFELPVEKLGAIETARRLNVDRSAVFKTIVVTRQKPKRPLLVLVPAATTVDLRLVATAVGEKKVHLPTEREAEALTRLQAGGISPLALLNKGFQVLLDVSAQNRAEIHVSGGQRGLNIRLAVADLVQLTGAQYAPVSRPDEPSA
jgi:Cys-tRNA(Pro)/Cys-tRNA(Cys) deacylase